MSMGARQPGCFRYGCFIATVLAVVVFGSLTWWSIRSVRQAFELYTSDSPSFLSDVTVVSHNELVRGKAKWQRATDAFRANNDLNVQFSSSELMGAMRGLGFSNGVDVAFEGDRVKARFSVPLSLFGEWLAAEKLVGNVAERFLTGEVIGKISISDNKPKIDCERLVLNDSLLEEMARRQAATWLEGAVQSVLQGARGSSHIEQLAISDSLLNVSLARDRSGQIK